MKPRKIDYNMIRTYWELADEDFPDKSTEFLMEIVCQRYNQQFGTDIDHGDVATALVKTGEGK